MSSKFLVPTRQRGNPFSTRQRRCSQEGTLARPDWVPTLARGNQKNRPLFGLIILAYMQSL